MRVSGFKKQTAGEDTVMSRLLLFWERNSDSATENRDGSRSFFKERVIEVPPSTHYHTTTTVTAVSIITATTTSITPKSGKTVISKTTVRPSSIYAAVMTALANALIKFKALASFAQIAINIR